MKHQSTTPKRRTPLWKDLIFGTLIMFGTFAILDSLAGDTLRDKIGGTLAGLAFALPGLWFFLHERRANAGAAPLKRHWRGVTGACLALFASGMAVVPPVEKPAEEPKSLVNIPTSTPTSTPTPTPTPTATPTLKPTTSTTETKPAEPPQEQPPREEQQAPAPVPAQVPEPEPAPAPVAPPPVAPAPVAPPPAAPAPVPQIEGVKPGAFCKKSLIGQTAIGNNGRTYTCTSNGSGTPHWQ